MKTIDDIYRIKRMMILYVIRNINEIQRNPNLNQQQQEKKKKRHFMYIQTEWNGTEQKQRASIKFEEIVFSSSEK